MICQDISLIHNQAFSTCEEQLHFSVVAGETCQVQVEREANGATEVVEEELPFSVLLPETL